jgi:aminoglycoside phosphotransferase (APT) family kinase protein
VEREYRVMRALADTQVPVPRMLHMCDDESIIGQTFFVMQHVPGRVFADPLMAGSSPSERAAIYADMNRVLACLQAVDYRAVGLDGFGRPEGYIERQIARWSKQYAASKLSDLPDMDKVIDWLPKHLPDHEETAIVHGDYRLGNLIIDPHEARVAAVLDWELATLGHPLADLAYNCLAYHVSKASGRGFGDTDLAALGIPDEASYLRDYCAHSGRGEIDNWRFFVVLALFRIAAILVGVHRRAVDGNAADARAIEIAGGYPEIAAIAWEIACR